MVDAEHGVRNRYDGQPVNRRSVKAFFFNDPATTEIYTLSLHDALPICSTPARCARRKGGGPEARVALQSGGGGPGDGPGLGIPGVRGPCGSSGRLRAGADGRGRGTAWARRPISFTGHAHGSETLFQHYFTN